MDKSKISIPVEGVNLPDRPLTNFQLIYTVKEFKIPHLEECSCEMIYLADI